MKSSTTFLGEESVINSPVALQGDETAGEITILRKNPENFPPVFTLSFPNVMDIHFFNMLLKDAQVASCLNGKIGIGEIIKR